MNSVQMQVALLPGFNAVHAEQKARADAYLARVLPSEGLAQLREWITTSTDGGGKFHSAHSNSVALVHGPPGTGKTTITTGLLQSAGYRVVLHNASLSRSPAKITETVRAVREAAGRLALIVDELDGPDDADASWDSSDREVRAEALVAQLKRTLDSTRRKRVNPVVLVCNRVHAHGIKRAFAARVVLVPFYAYRHDAQVQYAQRHLHVPSHVVATRIATAAHGDMRQLVMQAALWWTFERKPKPSLSASNRIEEEKEETLAEEDKLAARPLPLPSVRPAPCVLSCSPYEFVNRWLDDPAAATWLDQGKLKLPQFHRHLLTLNFLLRQPKPDCDEETLLDEAQALSDTLSSCARLRVRLEAHYKPARQAANHLEIAAYLLWAKVTQPFRPEPAGPGGGVGGRQSRTLLFSTRKDARESIVLRVKPFVWDDDEKLPDAASRSNRRAWHEDDALRDYLRHHPSRIRDEKDKSAVGTRGCEDHHNKPETPTTPKAAHRKHPWPKVVAPPSPPNRLDLVLRPRQNKRKAPSATNPTVSAKTGASHTTRDEPRRRHPKLQALQTGTTFFTNGNEAGTQSSRRVLLAQPRA